MYHRVHGRWVLFTFAWPPKPVRAHRVLVGSKIGRLRVSHDALFAGKLSHDLCMPHMPNKLHRHVFAEGAVGPMCFGLWIAPKNSRGKNHKALARLCPQSVSYMFSVSLRRLRPPNEFSHLFDPDDAFDVRSPRVQRNANGFRHVINVYRRYGKRVGHRVQGRRQSERERGR